MATQIPIGVIDAARGGTCIETWLPLDLLKTIDTPEVKAALSDWDTRVADFNPQKDLDARVKQFNDKMARLKASGKEKEIPASRTPPTDLRPGPAMDMNRLGNCYASSFDQRRAWFHPQIKIPVGERIAGWALVTQYGKSGDLRWLPPTIPEMKVEGGKMILKMARYEVITYNDGPILGFAIAGKDGKFQPAKAEWIDPNNPGDRSIIVLSSPLVAEPVYYPHGWGRNPLANLKADGIPLHVLRNDNFTVADMYEIYTGKKSATPNILDGVEFRDLRNAFKAEDVKHRLKEAEDFIKEHQDTSKALRNELLLHAARNESGERSGVSPSVPRFLYRQADACRSPIVSPITANYNRIQLMPPQEPGPMKNKHSQARRAFALSSIAIAALALSSLATVSAAEQPIPRPDGKPADMTKPVQVFILLGQSNMVGLGKVKGSEISLEHAVKENKKYQYLVDDAGAWTERKDVRYVRYMSGNGPLNNEWRPSP